MKDEPGSENLRDLPVMAERQDTNPKDKESKVMKKMKIARHIKNMK